jgi:G3E family GTPase
MNARVPIVLVTGPLGSGKTSLMGRLLDLAGAEGLRPAVVVNEFGSVGIDGTLLGAAGATALYEVSGGCICCTSRDALGQALRDLARRRPDLILVETSGLADPVATLDAVTAPDLLATLRVGGTVTLLDPAQPPRPGRLPALAERCLALADLVVIGKPDLVGPADLLVARRRARQANPKATIVEAVHGAVAADLLRPLLRGRVPATARHARLAPDHAHEPAHALAVPLPRPLDRDAFEGWLAALPAGVLRAKGFVRFAGDDALHLFQYATGVRAVGRIDLRAAPEPVAVIIGADLDEAALRAGLATCAAGPALAGAGSPAGEAPHAAL